MKFTTYSTCAKEKLLLMSESTFGILPREACKSKDESLIEPKLTWERLNKEDNEVMSQPAVTSRPEEVYLGVSKDQYKLILEAQDLQSLFEFDDEKTNIAFRISKAADIDLRKAFEFVEDYCFYLDMDNLRKEFNDDGTLDCMDLIDMFMQYGAGVDESLEILNDLYDEELDMDFLNETIMDTYRSFKESINKPRNPTIVEVIDLYGLYEEKPDKTECTFEDLVYDFLCGEDVYERIEWEKKSEEDFMNHFKDDIPDHFDEFSEYDERQDNEFLYGNPDGRRIVDDLFTYDAGDDDDGIYDNIRNNGIYVEKDLYDDDF